MLIPGYDILEKVQDDPDLEIHRGRRIEDGASVLLCVSVSRFPDRRVIEKAEREWSLRSELDPTFALVPLALVSEQGRPVLVLADPGGGPLTTQLARAWTVTRMIGFAISLAQAIGRVHAANLIHKDIKPANVWVDSAGEAKLTGFGIATRLPRERQTPEPPQTIVGTLAYMSPEQTGRMNRSLDSRSDLYSLGATLYELVTGVLPFAASDPMEWVHSHVARQPVPPADRFETAPVWRPEPIPRQLSDIIVRLLAKAAEDRYQTAAGVAADLARCLEQWEREGRIGAFVLGERDAASRLLMPEKLYGREAETRRLLEAFDRVVKTGVSELVLVTGYSGIGKSALVNELHKVIVLPRGLYAAGKFDQYKRNVLYDTLAQAGRSLVQQLLGKSETEVARWRSAITQAVGDHGQLIVDLIPELEALIGKQPAVPPLSFQEAEHRFHGVFRAFLRVFARKEHPLALFLDDLQWHDSASLKLLESLITDPELRHLLLIGAYRDREVDPSHPLTRTLEVIAKSHTRISELVLRPLSRSDLQRLLADALHCDKAHVEGLAKLVHDKTAGNPFFATQLIASLHDEQLLFFDAATGVWRWDMERIREKRFSDNVADLMVGKLERLPTATREVLKVFACLGNTIDAPTLAKAHGKTEAETQRDLWESIKAGFTLPVGGTHRFLHDRIREAAFSLIPEAARASEHLRIGRLLLAGLSKDEVEERLFLVLGLFNVGQKHLVDRAEMDLLRHLNILALHRARAASAFGLARDCGLQAMALLAPDAWTTHYDETYQLTLTLAECEGLLGNFARAEELFQTILDNARTVADRSQVYLLRSRQHRTSGQYESALQILLEGARLFGVEFPESPAEIAAATEDEARETTRLLADRRVSDLYEAPTVVDPNARAMISTLSEVQSGVYVNRPQLLRLATHRALNAILRHGNSEDSCYAYSFHAIMLAIFSSDLAKALEFSKLALRLADKYRGNRFQGVVYLAHGAAICVWQKPFAHCRPFLEHAYLSSLEVGDYTSAGQIACFSLWHALEEGLPLDEVRAQIAKGLAFAKLSRSDVIRRVMGGYERAVSALQGRTNESTSEPRDEHGEKPSDFVTGEAMMSIGRQMLGCVFGDFSAALAAAAEAKVYLSGVMGTAAEASHHFYLALAMTASHETAAPEVKGQFREMLAAIVNRYDSWAKNCPQNFRNRQRLIEAELARLDGRDMEAMRLYEEAIGAARDGGFVHNESLANEFAARFHLARGFETIGHAYLRNARLGYLRWGATAKVKQIDQRFPGLADRTEGAGPTMTFGATVDELDLMTVVKASQAVSGEIILGTLIEKLLSIVVAHAGADRGLLILPHDQVDRADQITKSAAPVITQHAIEAEAVSASAGIEVRVRRSAISQEVMPESVFNYVLRTGESVVLSDVAAAHLFSKDPYLEARRPRSVLCMPLLRQSRLVGALYLENHLSPRAFTPDRISVISIIASQAAISLENARLYAHLEEERARLRTVIRRVPAGLVIAEASGRMVVANEQYEDILKMPFKSQDWTAYTGFHPDGRPYDPEEWPLARSIRTGETVKQEELDVLTGDGSRISLTVNSGPVHDAQGQITAGIVIFQDITEKKAIERERERLFHQLRAEREQLGAILNLMPVPILLLEPYSAKVEFANKAAQSLAGGHFPQDDSESPTGEGDGHCTDSLGRRLRGDLSPDRRASRGETFHDVEVTWHRESGARSLLLNSETLRDKDGNPTIVVLAFQDLTPLKHAEEQLRQSQKMEAIGRLTGGIAHDFNNLLAVINGYSHLALAEMGSAHPLHHLLKEILNAGERAASLTKQLLVYSRRQIFEPKLWNLNAIVSDMSVMLERLIGEDIVLTTTLNPVSGWIKADRSQVEQILLNLVVNARDAMPEGGRLEVESGTFYLDEEYTRHHPGVVPGAYVMLRVSDTGVGMTPAVMAHIFEPFFTTKEAGKGTGLGLSVVFGIVKESGGHIDLVSQTADAAEGVRLHGHSGTTFRIYFPRADAPEDGMVESLPIESPYRGTETVLLVEDERAVREFVCRALESMGYKVLQAANGREAVEKMSRPHEPIDIVITDVVMPNMGGRELADRLTRLLPGLPVIFISGYLEQPVLRNDDSEREERFLQKPFNPMHLALTIRELLDENRERLPQRSSDG